MANSTQCRNFNLDNPNVQWSLCPNEGAAWLFCILFAVTTIAHLVQCIMTKKAYCIVIIMSGLWQTLAFAFRIVSMLNPTSEILYAVWFVLILVAPLWTNAFAYMVMGRMTWHFMPEQKVFKIKAWRMGTIFVLLDIFSFLIQFFGASTASGTNASENTILTGLHIYMAGIGVQQLFIVLFIALAIRFHLKLNREPAFPEKAKAIRLLYVVYIVLFLITIRILFRLGEYSSGIKSKIANKEAFMYCLDSLPMFTALALFNIVHPGYVMPEQKWPSRKVRKAARRAGEPIAPEKSVKTPDDQYNLLPVAEQRSESPFRYDPGQPIPAGPYEPDRTLRPDTYAPYDTARSRSPSPTRYEDRTAVSPAPYGP